LNEAPYVRDSLDLPTKEFNIYRAEFLWGNFDESPGRTIFHFRDNILPGLGDYLGDFGC